MVKDVTQLEVLMALLPSRVASLLSIQNLRGDLQAAHETVARWLMILENLYFCFRLSPYYVNQTKLIKKEQKLYLWDHSLVEEKGPRFENMLASHLLKLCHFESDYNGTSCELSFLRDREKRELDFIVIKDRKILFAVEAKYKETSISSHWSYFRDKYEIPYLFQVHLKGTKDTELPKEKVRILPFHRFTEAVKSWI